MSQTNDLKTRLSGPDGDLLSGVVTVRAIRDTAREVDFVFSSDSIDTYGERVDQNSWRLERFAASPVVLFAHQSRALPIGQAKNVGVRDGKLQGTVVVASEKANPLAEQVWQSLKEGTLRAGSVGFLPHTLRWEKENDNEVLVLADCELLEFSICPIGANPDALARMRSRAAGLRSATDTAPAPAAPSTTEKAAERSQTEIENMDKDQEIAALKAKVAERDGEAAVAKSKALDAEKSARDAAARDVEKDTKIKALESQTEHLAKERDAEKAGRELAEGALIELEIGAIVGKKITPAEKDLFVQLRKSNPVLCKSMIDQRGEMGLDKQAIPTDGAMPPPVEKNAAADVSDAVALAEFQKAVA